MQNGVLNLDPKTDETIYTTESGIEIKSHNIAGQTVANSQVQYFTLGSYNGEPVNWIILAASTQMVETTSPAGVAVNTETSKQVVSVMTDSMLSTNQILCISEYAFDIGAYTPDFVAHEQVTYTFTSWSQYKNFSVTTDSYTDYIASSYTKPIDYATSKVLELGTTLKINGYYGTGSGKIVTNSTFSSNYVFSLSSSNYTNFVGANYNIPYLFNSTSSASVIWTGNVGLGGTVTSTCGSRGNGGIPAYYYVSGSGAGYAYLSNLIAESGVVSSNITISNFSATSSDTGGYFRDSDGYRLYHYKTTYSLTKETISIAYRPAFVFQL